MRHPPLGRSYLVVVPSYDASCALILLTGLYWLDFMADSDINPSSMGPIFAVWIGPTLGSQNVPSAIGPKLFGSRGILLYGIDNCYLHKIHWSPFGESNIAAKFSSAAAKINCGYNILAPKYFAAAPQRKKLTLFTIPIYIYKNTK